MPTIHAFRRTKKTVHEYGGVNYTFEPNARGHAVCQVAEEAAAERFLSITTGFRLYDEQQPEPEVTNPVLTQAPAPAPAPAAPASTAESDSADKPPADADQPPGPNPRFVLTAGEQSFDLNPLTEDELRNFAAANQIKLHPAVKKLDTIREVIVKHFEKPATEQAATGADTAEKTED